MDNNNQETPKVVQLDGDIAGQINETKIDPVPVTPEVPYQDPTAPTPTVEDLIAATPEQPVKTEETVAPVVEQTKPAEEVTEELATVPAETIPSDDNAGTAPEVAQQAPVEQTEEVITPSNTVAEVDDVLEEFRNPTKSTTPRKAKNEGGAELVVNQLLLGNREDLVEDMKKFYPDAQATKQATNDPDSFFNKVVSASVNGWNTGAANTLTGPLVLNDKIGDRLTQQSTCPVPRIADGRPKGGHHANQRVTGKEARLLIRARLGGLYRVNLFNSGFWVALRAPQLTELNELFTAIDIEGKEIGRTIGAHYALVSDMYLKKKFVEMLVARRIIVESNFSDIYKNGAFIRNLSFHDYDVLMHGVVTLMARNGMRTRLVCPKCGEVTSDQTIDISACKFVNMDLMTNNRWDPNVPSVLEWWQQAGRNERGEAIYRTEEDLRYYRDKVLHNTRQIVQEVDNGLDGKAKMELVLQTPTMWQFFQVGQTLIDQLNATIAGISQGEEDKEQLVRAALTIQGFQLITPWVRELRAYKDDGKEVDFTTDDSNVIMEYLDTTIQEGQSGDMFDELNQYVADSRFNYIGSFSLECPKCHAKPESNLDNFFPMEIETIFFGLLFRLLPSA